MKVFIPVSDDMLDQLDPGEEFVPYQVGLCLLSRLSAKSQPADVNANPGEAPEHRRPEHPIQPPCQR